MELDRDILFSIALELDLPTLLKFCSSNKRINNLICKRDDIWRAKIKKEYPMIDIAMISQLLNPRETYMKIIDAKVDSQKKFDKYLYERDYEMRDILPKIYHVRWSQVGVVYDSNPEIIPKLFTVQNPNLSMFGFYKAPEFKKTSLSHKFQRIFMMGLMIENVKELQPYKDEIDKLRNAFSPYTKSSNKLDEFREPLIEKLDSQVPNLRNILEEAVKRYLYENHQVYDISVHPSELYLV